ncbi:MAG: trypsin-like serine protease, partial [Myxococcota bacterium]
GNFITIDGEGERGVCFGDSGGPLMVIASDGTVRIAGVLSGGDGSCVGRDNYTRVDVFRDWIESYTGPTVVEGASCGEVDDVGRCLNNQALWCDGEQLRAQTCDGATSCGWDEDTQGYRCILGDDPCQGIDAFGQCNGQTALWCDRGQLRSRDCGSCDQTCSVMTEYNGVYCEEDPCRGLDYYGQCDGNVVEYCDDGQYRAVDCASEGLRCVWFNERVGYWCN